MYYILYGFLYVVSLLPFAVLYFFSDVVAFILQHVTGYRKDVIAQNLQQAFPEKNSREITDITKKFYKNFTDNFIETLKLVSMPAKEFDSRMVTDMSACNRLAAAGKNIQFNSGHQMNWEYASLAISKHLQLPWLAIYKKIENNAAERLVLKIRSKFGATMVAIEDYAFRMPALMKNRYALGLIADQNPAHAHQAYWLNFFYRPTAFLPGTDKSARRNKTAVVFVNIVKIKRGYYKLELEIVTENAGEFQDGELTRRYRDFLEKNIQQQPGNYLWSHKRWKLQYHDGLQKKWVDSKEPAAYK